jgi:hypothetical protein
MPRSPLGARPQISLMKLDADLAIGLVVADNQGRAKV